MTKPAVTYPDVEELTIGYLTEDLDGCTVGIGLPDRWTVESEPHVQVACDGTPIDRHPIAQVHTVRLTAWAKYTPDAKALAQEAKGWLLTHVEFSKLTGLLPAHDPDHDAELASVTVRATVRATPL